MSEPLELNDDDVVDMDAGKNPFSTSTFKVSRLLAKMAQILKDYKMADWQEGVPCEVLSVKTGGWKPGKLYVRFEFVPDQPESPLDEMREKPKRLSSHLLVSESQAGE